MPYKRLTTLTFGLLVVAVSTLAQEKTIERSFDESKNISTIRAPATRVVYEKGKYHSLDFSLSYSFTGTTLPATPESIDLELVSVVKARRLNSDLYVVFLIDDKPVHFGSNRSAIQSPVPGRLWIGERMIFKIPHEDFVKFASAEKLAIKLGGDEFALSQQNRDLLRKFAAAIVP